MIPATGTAGAETASLAQGFPRWDGEREAAGVFVWAASPSQMRPSFLANTVPPPPGEEASELEAGSTGPASGKDKPVEADGHHGSPSEPLTVDSRAPLKGKRPGEGQGAGKPPGERHLESHVCFRFLCVRASRSHCAVVY